MWSWLLDRIDLDLLPIKAHYFLFNAGTAPVQPFITVYVKQLGFSSTVVGIIYAILPILGLVSKLGVGALADRLRLRRTLFLSFLLIATLSFFMVQFVPEVKTVDREQLQLDCGIQSNIKICYNLTTDQRCFGNEISADDKKDPVTVRCQLRCQVDPALCAAWRIPPCTLPNSSMSWVDLESDIPLEHSLTEDNCLYIRLSNFTLSDTNTIHQAVCRDKQVLHTKCVGHCAHAPKIETLFRNVSLPDDATVARSYQLWLLLLLLIASWIGMAVVVSLSDAICFEVLEDRGHLYGRQRLWGSLGWGIFALISGLLVDHFSQGETEKNYTPAFYLLLILWLIDFWCSLRLPHDQHNPPHSIATDLGHLLRNPQILSFLCGCIVVGMCTGLQWSFLYWYLEDLSKDDGGCSDATWTKTLQGLVSGVQCLLGEIPYFFISGYVIKKLGHSNSMSLILGLISIRFFLYSILSNPWWVLPIELFQGAYGLLYPTMASFANTVAPSGTEATIQGLVGAVFEGVGVALGSLLAGYSFDTYGGAVTFQIFGGLALVTCACFITITGFLLKRAPNPIAGPKGGHAAADTLADVVSSNHDRRKTGNTDEVNPVE